MVQVRGKLLKRTRQLGALVLNPIRHRHARALLAHRAVGGLRRSTQFKYLGDYLSLSFTTAERLSALTGHYQRFGPIGQALGPTARWQDGLLLWDLADAEPDMAPLQLTLEQATIAPMEGELQLRVAAGSQLLFALTFSLLPGHLFALTDDTVIFIGGVQGGVNCRLAMRQAAKRNGEIAPAAMLLLAIRALAAALGIATILAVSEHDQIAKSYASDKIKFDYQEFWKQAGGRQHGSSFVLPSESEERPLLDIPISHRRRTKRKRQRRDALRQRLETRIRDLLAISRQGQGAQAGTVSPRP